MGASRITSGNASRLQTMWVHSHHWLAKYVDMNEPTTTDSGIGLDELKAKNDRFEHLNVDEIEWLIERLRTAEATHQEQVEREIRVRNNVIAELEAERDKAQERAEFFEGAMNSWATDARRWEAERDRMELERDDLKERLRTTRLEQAAKAFQVDELETKVERLTTELAIFRQQHNDMQIYPIDLVAELQEQVERLTAEHEKDRQAWMSENTELLTQVERLTEELGHPNVGR